MPEKNEKDREEILRRALEKIKKVTNTSPAYTPGATAHYIAHSTLISLYGEDGVK
ncbi:hypothetical protein D1872_81560 [compost metagenome]